MAFQLPPLPNFNVQTPDMQKAAIQSAQLASMLSENKLRQQLAPLQVQEQQQKTTQAGIQTQTQQMDLESRQAMFKALSDPDFVKSLTGTPQADSSGLGFDPNAVGQALYSRGVKDPNMINEFVNGLITRSKNIADIYKSQAETSASRVTTHEKGLKILADKIGAILDKPLDKATTALDALKQDLVNNPKAYEGVPHDDLAHIFSADLGHLPAMASLIGLDRDLADYHKGKSEATKAGVEATEAQAQAAGQVTPKMATEQRLKLHLATATKAAEQAIADGDPRAAAQLLISGTVAPSQLISSRKPAFAQQAFTAATQMQPGWSATKADADYKVATSSGNVAFFGSAKSLTDPGGTLDQLAAAGKDIPGNKIPVFNTVADAIKASTGSGPIAKYATIALGVADDWGRIMGGGQGSDTSREQALRLISASQSPEQRAASIEGIRGAVNSQTQSRIGNNAVLQKMYGSNLNQGGGPPPGATHIVPGSDGKKHWTNAKGTVDYGIAP